MPIYFLLSIRVLISVGREPTPQAYLKGAPFFYNALTTAATLLAQKGPCRRKSVASSEMASQDDVPRPARRHLL
jgi:hypothetical protein